ncbi:unnamed protein product [Rhizophagus irregularis]|uniref:Uncharacterized protein n=1 Tax=Rhizophagus irregularis TaxID=588596 RepID=A0A2N1MRK3_9GLOM|nr:hypothetical protein RhiirC2_787751 [Rhizophagus irregularis]CAB4380483.1 unnamed protein product [Rhizophagus irregularis]CAB5373429.1 unnamed protein product [Rhizophagus irregularis]
MKRLKPPDIAIGDLSSIIAIATFNLGNLKKFASAISSGVFGDTALHKIINIKRFQKIIGEHNEVQKNYQRFTRILERGTKNM